MCLVDQGLRCIYGGLIFLDIYHVICFFCFFLIIFFANNKVYVFF